MTRRLQLHRVSAVSSVFDKYFQRAEWTLTTHGSAQCELTSLHLPSAGLPILGPPLDSAWQVSRRLATDSYNEYRVPGT